MKLKVEKFEIDGEIIPFFGNKDSTMDVKFNRVARIASRYTDWTEKLLEHVDFYKGFPTTTEYNLGVALLVIMKTGIRIGNETSSEGFYSDYKEKGKTVLAKTYGLTTMLPEHTAIKNEIVHFNFTGKKHVENLFILDPLLSKLVIPIIRSDYPTVFNIDESMLTRFIKSETSVNLSSKDFRTFRANVLAYGFTKLEGTYETKSERKEKIRNVVEKVAEKLNNTPGVVRSSYLDMRLFDYLFPDITSKQFGGQLLSYRKHY